MNNLTWPQIKRKMRLLKYKPVSEQHTEAEFVGLFQKESKLAIVRKPKRGKVTKITWLDWTKAVPNEELLNETYPLADAFEAGKDTVEFTVGWRTT